MTWCRTHFWAIHKVKYNAAPVCHNYFTSCYDFALLFANSESWEFMVRRQKFTSQVGWGSSQSKYVTVFKAILPENKKNVGLE